MKGFGLKNAIIINDREFQVHTGNDAAKNIILSEVFESGNFLFGAEESYTVRDVNREEFNTDYLKQITYEQHQNTLEEIKTLFLVYEKIKQLRQYLPHFRLGKVFLNRNFIDEAIDNFKRVIELNPRFVRGHQMLGLAYLHKNLFKDAFQAYKQAYEMQPDFPDILNGLGVVCTNLNDYSTATKMLNKAMEMKTDYHEANFNLGIVLFLSSLDDEENDEKVIIPARFMRSFKSIVMEPRYSSERWKFLFQQTKEILDEGKRKNVISVLAKLQLDILTANSGSDIMDYFFLQFMYGGKEINSDELETFEELIVNEVYNHNDYADYWNELGIIHLIQCREYFLKAISEFEKSHKMEPRYESAKKNVELLKHNKNGFLILLRAILK